MNKHYRSLFPALAVMASLCWQIPVSAQSWEHRGVAAPQAAQRYNRPPGPVPTYSNNSNGGASRYPRYPGSGPGPGPAPGYPGRYPSHPVYPGYPYARYPVYPGYSVYPRYPAYYPYPVYPRYYGYYGVAVYPSYYPAPVPVPVPVPAPYGYGPVGAPGCGGAAPALGVA